MTNEEARLQLALREMEFDRDNQRRRAEEAESRAREAVEREQVAVNEAAGYADVIAQREAWLDEIAGMLPPLGGDRVRDYSVVVADVRTELGSAAPRSPVDREAGGRLVREVWVDFARSQPNPKPHHLLPWEQLDEANKEVDRLIAERVTQWALAAVSCFPLIRPN